MFFFLNTTHRDWMNRIPAEAIARLASHHTAISNISGEANEPPRLIVNTYQGAYIFIGEFNHHDAPETALINLLHDCSIEMCAPVRVTALQLLRKQTN